MDQKLSAGREMIITDYQEGEREDSMAVATRSPPDNTVASSSGQTSDARANLSRVFNATRFLVGVSSAATKVGFEAAKFFTKTGLDVARGVVSEVGRTTGLEAAGVTPLANGVISVAEFFAISGIEIGQYWTKFGISTADRSVKTLDNMFGSGDVAVAVRKFIQLVQRELKSSSGDDSALADIGTVDAFRALMAWISLQRATSVHWWEEGKSTGRRLKFVKSKQEDLDRAAAAETEEVDWAKIAGGATAEPGDLIRGSIGEPGMAAEKREASPDRSNPSGSASASASDWSALGNFAAAGSAAIVKSDSKRLSGSSDRQTSPNRDRTVIADTQLLHDLQRYAKFSTGMYGRYHIGALNGEITVPLPNFPPLPFVSNNIDPRQTTGTEDDRFFSKHADTPLESLYHSSGVGSDDSGWKFAFSNDSNAALYSPTVYVIADHPHKQVILAFRGTSSFEDVMVDLSCEYEEFDWGSGHEIDGPSHARKSSTYQQQPEKVHSGMMAAAREIASHAHKSGIFKAVSSLLSQNPSYGLLLTGHSLGAGLATCLTFLWTDPSTYSTSAASGLPAGRAIRCFAYAAPCVASPILSVNAKPVVTSIALGADLVPRLSLGSVQDLARIVRWIHKRPEVRDRTATDSEADIALRAKIEEECLVQEKLYPAGRIIWVFDTKPSTQGDDTADAENAQSVATAFEIEVSPEGHPHIPAPFNQIVFTSRLGSDHLPHIYPAILQRLT
ncbi:uncharacterized protein EV422DRAFT_564035 [Fimicolochytrium jonesii]|uniref:uncharacterized protein n=1 Tax=Fimicolochytrium jonesii TaxID=1396493 RepID=UPI0022FF24C5|nr:uncharacterized protein EV422DRAFT_564035 [Fimicolochytrium jonesii]KAI8826225.1 hypothetical protein EV422DRAFT_564035 [Fimicolochytrium jonesii]